LKFQTWLAKAYTPQYWTMPRIRFNLEVYRLERTSSLWPKRISSCLRKLW